MKCSPVTVQIHLQFPYHKTGNSWYINGGNNYKNFISIIRIHCLLCWRNLYIKQIFFRNENVSWEFLEKNQLELNLAFTHSIQSDIHFLGFNQLGFPSSCFCACGTAESAEQPQNRKTKKGGQP